MFEENLLELDVEWIRLKIYEKNNIAIGSYRHKKHRAIGKRNRSIYVVAFVSGPGLYGTETANEIPGTEQKFRKNEKVIAEWYFRKLCRTLKKGIIQGKQENRPFGKWD